MSQNEGYFVMGFGEKYIDECEKMITSLKCFDNVRPVAIMTHERDREYVLSKNVFDKIIYVDEDDIKDDNTHNSFCVKSRVHMPKYMPYEKMISLDSDMICIHNPQQAWDFFNNRDVPFMCCGYDYERHWHWNKVDKIIQIVGKNIPSIHGGVLFFNKSHNDFNNFYETTKEVMNNYDAYGCHRAFRGGMTDEVIFSISMAKYNILPLNYEKYPIVSFNLPSDIKLPAYIQSREGENTGKHIKTEYPTIFNHLFFHEKTMPKERQMRLERWYNELHERITVGSQSQSKLRFNFVAVTALYDIGRKDRKFDFYINYFSQLLSFKMPLVVFCNSSTYDHFKSIKREHYTQFIVRELEELDFYKKHHNEIKENISQEIYKKNVMHYGRPETIHPNYNVIQYSKFDFLQEAKKMINAEYYMWIDAGAPRFFKSIPETIWPNSNLFNNKIIVQTFMVKEIRERFLSNFCESIGKIQLKDECKNSRYLIIGTNFVVPNKDVHWLRDKINSKFKEMLQYGYLNNEQVAMEFVVKENMNKFDIKVNNSEKWYNMMEYI